MHTNKVKIYIHSMLRLAIIASWVSFNILLYAYSESALAKYLITPLSMGLLYAHLIQILHESVHGTLFNRKIDTIIGSIIGLPSLTNFFRYRHLHLNHHRFLGSIKDKEFFSYDHMTNMPNLKKLILEAISLKRYQQKIIDTFSYKEKKTNELVLDALYVLVHSAIIIINIKFYLSCVVVANLIVTNLVSYLIELPEHFMADRSSTSIWKNTNSFDANFIYEWFTNYNNRHIEHHLYPAIPSLRLRDIDIKHLTQNSYNSFSEYLNKAFKLYRNGDI